MEITPIDYRPALVLGAFGLTVLVLVGITAAVALMDIRRELRRLRREVRTATHAAREAADAGRARAIDLARELLEETE